jgi:predicted nucleic acid-binding protein
MPAAEPVLTAAVLDASVAVRWIVPERGSDEAAALLHQSILWVAPRLMLTEAASALRRKVAAGEVRTEVAVHALNALLEAIADGTVLLADDENFMPSALALALSLGHKLPDCLYLAVAERDGLALATADARLGRLARQRGIRTYVVPSA